MSGYLSVSFCFKKRMGPRQTAIRSSDSEDDSEDEQYEEKYGGGEEEDEDVRSSDGRASSLEERIGEPCKGVGDSGIRPSR